MDLYIYFFLHMDLLNVDLAVISTCPLGIVEMKGGLITQYVPITDGLQYIILQRAVLRFG